MTEYVSDPTISTFDEQPCIGIRTTTQFRGMSKVVELQMKELRKWVNAQGIAEEGPYFLRYHVIDMAGMMDIEVGFITAKPMSGDGRVMPGALPAGRYAHVTYSRFALQGHRTLVEWIKEQGLPADRWESEAGDVFACRYEVYLTDYRVEPRKKDWQIRLAIRLKDD